MRKRYLIPKHYNQAKPRPKNPTISSTATLDWKNHPIIVAAGSSAATAVLITGVFTQIVIPTQLMKLENESLKKSESINHLANKVSENEASINKLEAEVKSLNSINEKLQGELLISKTTNMFTSGNPFPNGLGLIRIGSSLKEVFEVFDKSQIEDPNHLDYISVAVNNSPIKNITYYLSDDRSKITHIAFSLEYESNFPDDFLKNKLTEALGLPTSTPRPGYYMWKIPKKWNVQMNDTDRFIILDDEHTLASWPEGEK